MANIKFDKKLGATVKGGNLKRIGSTPRGTPDYGYGCNKPRGTPDYGYGCS